MKIIRCVTLVLLVVAGSSARANGNLHSLIIELQNLKGLVALQAQKRHEDERWIFRYDLLQRRLDTIIIDIEKHIALKQQLPNIKRREVDVSLPQARASILSP